MLGARSSCWTVGLMFASRLVAAGRIFSAVLSLNGSVISLQFEACCVFLERGETFKPALYWGSVNIKVDS